MVRGSIDEGDWEIGFSPDRARNNIDVPRIRNPQTHAYGPTHKRPHMSWNCVAIPEVKKHWANSMEHNPCMAETCTVLRQSKLMMDVPLGVARLARLATYE
jgi:hypothetical protein